MANDRNRTDEYTSPEPDRSNDMGDERVRGGASDDLRGVADEADEDLEDLDDLEEDEDDGSF